MVFKSRFVSILILLGALFGAALQAEVASIPPAGATGGSKWDWGVEGSLLVCDIHGTGTRGNWYLRPGLSGGLWAGWNPNSWLMFRAGADYMSHASAIVLDHPYPYVFTSSVNLATKSIRIPLTASIHPLGWIGLPGIYLGGGGFADVIVDAEVREAKHYLYYLVRADRNVTQDVPGVTYGWELHLGSLPWGKYGVEFGMQYIPEKFSIDGLPAGRLTRMNYSLKLYFPLAEYLKP